MGLDTDCYLMACLGRQDIWPVGDIGLQEGVRRLKNLNVRALRI